MIKRKIKNKKKISLAAKHFSFVHDTLRIAYWKQRKLIACTLRKQSGTGKILHFRKEKDEYVCKNSRNIFFSEFN